MYNSIVFGPLDAAQIESDITEQYRQLTITPELPNGRVPNPSDPEFPILATIAYERYLSLISVDRAAQAMLVQKASGPNLDYLAYLIGVTRLDSSASLTRLQFTMTPGFGAIVIPAGTAVASVNGQVVYSTNVDVNVTETTPPQTVTIDASCTTDGAASNGYAIGTIKVMQNPVPYIQSATNLDITSGGADVETDEAFRSRWFAAVDGLGPAGPKGRYKIKALSANNTIIYVDVLGPEDDPAIEPGWVYLYVLVDTGVPTQGILDAVRDACNPDDARPMNDRPFFFAAIGGGYTVHIDIVAFDTASNISTMAAEVIAAVKVYTDAQSRKLGADIESGAVNAYGMGVPGVKRLDLGAFGNIPVAPGHFAYCTAITATVVSTEPA